jgi:hypothetical protein
VSEQAPAPDSPRASTAAREAARPTDRTERLPGPGAQPAADASVWGPRGELGSTRPAPHVTMDPPPVRPASSPGSAPPPAKLAAPGTPAEFPSTIGRLSRVRSSDLWADGAGLAGWLAASPEPLAETLGKPPFEFATSGTNILLGTSADQHPVCVVCEVGPSSDEALGILLRVAAVQEGGLVIWVAGEMGDAHVAALSWLNRSTSPRFYLVKVTGIRIDGSASAPIFELVARPPRAAAPAGSPSADGSAPSRPDGPRRRVEDHVQEA